jgi:WD40-like Beta Propeller Repeat
MGIKNLSPRTIGLLFILVFQVACTPTDQPTDSTGSETSLPPEATSISSDVSPTVPSAGTEATATSAVATSTPSVTPSATRVAIDWRDMPIMPEISNRVLEIYQEGQRQGRDPHSFSVVGDCQSIPYRFMGPFSIGELEPEPAEMYLWDAYNFFKPSFKRWGVTSRGGFTAASILASIQADPHYCKPGETPLTCEYRLNNPSVIFITLETWLYPSTIDRYEDYLRLILDYVIEHGTIPILLTKADAAEVEDGSHVINPAIVRVALDYDVPLVNFWRAAQYLDNIGIDPDRDGFHLSEEGYDVKNLLALRALYAVWQVVTTGSTGADSTPAAEETPSPGLVLEPETVLSIPECPGGCVYFGLADSVDGLVTLQGVFAYDLTTGEKHQVLGTGYDLQDVSEDGSRLLVNYSNFLIEADLTDGSTRLLSDTFYYLGDQGAYWNSDDTEVVLIDDSFPPATGSGSAYRLIPSSRDDEVYFETGSCDTKDYCHSGGIYRLEGDAVTPMDAYTRPVFSPDGEWMAFLNPEAATEENFHHIWYMLLEQPDQPALTRRVIYFPEEHGFLYFPDVRELAFSPDGQTLMVIYDVYSAYFENSQRTQTYLLDLSTGILYDQGKIKGTSASLDPHMVWSPDGNQVLFFLTESTGDDSFTLSLFRTDLETGEKLAVIDPDLISADDYFYLTNLYWR